MLRHLTIQSHRVDPTKPNWTYQILPKQCIDHEIDPVDLGEGYTGELRVTPIGHEEIFHSLSKWCVPFRSGLVVRDKFETKYKRLQGNRFRLVYRFCSGLHMPLSEVI